jgi:ABC-2 type transport system ATP-binding protein
MPEPAVSLKALSKSYGAVQAVRDLSLDIQPGEIFGLIGPNGAGKSTALECVLGLCEPDSGTILVHGLDIRERASEVRSVIGAQLQFSGQPDAMTPRQALKLCGSFYQHPLDAEALIERFQLSEKADARYSSLSSGQRQRLALALAFVNDPKIVILDEPSVGLDPPARRDLHSLIAAQKADGRTIVFTTHYLEEARNLCDRIGLIDRGALVAVDAPQALIERSGSLPCIRFRTVPSLAEDDLRRIPSVGHTSYDGAAWRIESTAVNKTVTALAALVEAKAADMLELEIHRPSLDDVFMELTRRAGD